MAKIVLLGLESSVGAALMEILTGLNHNVSTATIHEATRADVVFTNPHEVYRMRRAAPGVRVVVATRLPDTTVWLDALDAGASDYCAAPFESRQVQWVMDGLLAA